MGLHGNRKLKNVLDSWPAGQVVTSAWLSKKEISSQLVQRYLHSGWFEKLGVGAYKRPADTVEWYGAVASLQHQQLLDIHVGGVTAFSIRGASHYIRIGREQIFLYSSPQFRLPKWFTDFDWGNQINHVKSSVLPDKLGIAPYKFNGIEINVSAPERAILECLQASPKEFDLLECYQLLESQTTLRPVIMQRLLSECSSIRVKRLFLYMAEKANLPILQYLDKDKIDIGTGDRSIVKNGVYISKYRISVPKELVNYV